MLSFGMVRSSLLALAVLLPMSTMANAQKKSNSKTETPIPADLQKFLDQREANKDERMEWWRDARFGLFVHWGLYAVPAGTYDGKRIPGIGEWIMLRRKIPVDTYADYAKEFNPVKYDPDAWVRLVKEAGMKYIIITAKHHDGFALFDSAVTDYDVVDATPYKKDLLVPLAEACRKHGIKLGFYYSQSQDWHHPGGATAGIRAWDEKQKGSMDDYIRDIARAQVDELLSRNKDLAVLWWDTPGRMNRDRALALLPALKHTPNIITNNRLGGGFRGDTDTPEQHIPATGLGDRDFEVCMTMNGTWGFKSYDHNWKSQKHLIQNLVDIASKGGNYLLNVGPTAEGEIPAPSIERLKAVGVWMKVNGESIYGTQASPFSYLSWGRCTSKPGDDQSTLYLHVFNWPENGVLTLPKIANQAVSARLLAGNQTLEVTRSGDDLQIAVPADAPNTISSTIALTVKGQPQVGYVFPVQQADQSVLVLAESMLIHNPAYDSSEQIKVAEVKGAPTITNWISPRIGPEAIFKVSQAGDYEVSIKVRSASQSKLTIASGRKRKGQIKLQATIAPSNEFALQSLGTIHLSKGENRLRFTPDAKGWKPVELQSLELKPVSKP